MNYAEIIASIGSIATALALVWAVVQHRIDSKKVNEQIILERKRFRIDQAELLENLIEIRINKLKEITNHYTEIILVAEKLKWALLNMKDEAEKESKINIEDYVKHFDILSNILNELRPWQQAIIGDLPVDPMINGYYQYYNYTEAKQLIEWIEHFQIQIETALKDAAQISENAFKQEELLKKKRNFSLYS